MNAGTMLDDESRCCLEGSDEQGYDVTVATDVNERDSEMLAHAPADLALLLKVVEAAMKYKRASDGPHDAMSDGVIALFAADEALFAALAPLLAEDPS